VRKTTRGGSQLGSKSLPTSDKTPRAEGENGEKEAFYIHARSFDPMVNRTAIVSRDEQGLLQQREEKGIKWPGQSARRMLAVRGDGNTWGSWKEDSGEKKRIWIRRERTDKGALKLAGLGSREEKSREEIKGQAWPKAEDVPPSRAANSPFTAGPAERY